MAFLTSHHIGLMDGSPSLQDLAKVHRIHVSTPLICPGLLHKVMGRPILGGCPDTLETASVVTSHVGSVATGGGDGDVVVLYRVR